MEELETWKNFSVDSEMENGSHRVFNSALDLLDAHTPSQKLRKVFEKLKFAAKLNVSIGFLLKNIKRDLWVLSSTRKQDFNGAMRTRLYLRRFGKNRECVELHWSDRSVNKRTKKKQLKIYKLTNFLVSGALLKEVPMVYNDAVLTEPFTENHSDFGLTYEKNTTKP